ncbi:malto-oligosyltrehalose trehalohydrolase [Phycicoccus avicenniae]|uniref:malto-oligosyltrehalose trehalohydrolase n=1 Tax=Phycicoccus avicenniae TaxID=2828860 RepID=UPI003D29F1AB
MTAGDGWWRFALPEGAGEIDYAFVLDGDEPALPDPRSAWQPGTVHGPSRLVDTAAFPWTDEAWRGVRDGAGGLGAVFYELHVGTFTPEGTFDAAVQRLDHLVALGVDVVEVMPVAAFPTDRGWGYDGVGLYAVHDAYGGPHAFARFVDACHARGLGVCLDVVHNHLGASGNYLSRFGPYFTEGHHTPWGAAVNLDDDGSAQVRRFLVESTLRWLRDFHVDALRLDAVHELKDDSPRHYLAELSDAVAALSTELGRPLDLVAESDLNDTVMVMPTAEGGRGMTAQWDDDVHHALHVALTGEVQGYYTDFGGTPGTDEEGPLAVLAKVLTRGFLHDGTRSSFRDRDWGALVDRERLDARRLLGYLQTHDQVGNRATGERISALVEDPALQAAGAALYLLAPTTPMLFMGEEWAASTPWQFFTSFAEDWLADAVRDGRRAEFGSHGWSADAVPDPQDPATRDRSVLDWAEVERPDHARMLRWYTDLTALRRRLLGPGPTRLADVEVEVDEERRWVVLRHRPSGGEPYAVVATLAGAAEVPLVGAGAPHLEWEPESTSVSGVGVVHRCRSVSVHPLTPA